MDITAFNSSFTNSDGCKLLTIKSIFFQIELLKPIQGAFPWFPRLPLEALLLLLLLLQLLINIEITIYIFIRIIHQVEIKFLVKTFVDHFKTLFGSIDACGSLL
jgi:hypothetical protein